jgi:hypothetical protein
MSTLDLLTIANHKSYSYAEQYLVIIVANIPCLKGLSGRAFRTLGGKISSNYSDRSEYPKSYQRSIVRPRRSFRDDEYHESQRSLDKKNAEYLYRHDSNQQILMHAYPREPKRLRLVDERRTSTGRENRFVMKRVNEDVRWDGKKPGKPL